ncbi:X2-like carbohydrate binding domain-containing protein [Paenibacillus marchantiae]|uniref:X2-like carbohydrate binding domain-containing protein n=1 Tax=Paenibacillus marchantiae TaxID=3026433 RepID=UPI00237C4428|nr:X2-like carbohydrate binding domain-containing protein [Paenibacillus marchantiae]WDQ35561.1 X2-like carbohydrate binding domain-containing protein [Paenibacillus marchantiae]
MAMCFMVFMIAAVQFGIMGTTGNVAQAADKSLAQKPYMGWSSYSMQVYDGPGNWTSAESIKKQSDAMREKLQAHGYEYINIDAGWNGDEDEYGRPIPSTVLYPNGFQEVIDYVHNNGQKIGIYLIPGLSITAYDKNLEVYGSGGACRMQDIAVKPLVVMDAWDSYTYKIDFSNPCSQKYIDSIADLLGEWGINFVKFDSVTPGSGINNLSRDARGDVEAWSKALDRNNIWFELSWALDHNYVDFWKKYANGWRIDWDVEAYDSSKGLTEWSSISRLFPIAALWWRDAGPGGWNDFDSLNVGNGSMDGLTKVERQTATTFWSISSAPLYTGDDLTRLDSYGLELLTNDEVIAVNQAGRPGHPVSMETKQQVWYANNGDGTYSVALFNLGDQSAEVKVKWSDLGLNGPASVRDLWSHSELGNFNHEFSGGVLEPHASRMLKVTALNGTSAVNDDDTGMLYSGDWQRNGGKEQTDGRQDLSIAITDSSGTGPANSSQGGALDAEADNAANSISVEDATVTNEVYINDDDSSIKYTGSWNSNTGRSYGDYNGDVHFTEKDGDYFEYSFTGTGIELLTEKDKDQGDMIVTLDNGASETVNAYTSGEREVQQVLYSKLDLDNGPHTLKVVKGSGQYMLLDALRVTMEIPPGGQNSTISPTSANFDKETEQQKDVTVRLSLNGNMLTGVENDGVLLSDDDYTVVNDKLTIRKQYLTQLPKGTTSLNVIFSAGDPQSLAIRISDTTGIRFIMINNDDPAIKYNGSWSRSTGRGLGDYKDDVQYTEKNDDSFEYTFKGTGIQLFTEVDQSQGDMDIYVDDQFKETVSAHRNGRLAQQNLYSISGLPDGQHTLKAVKKSGEYMLLDMLKVELPNLINPVTADFDKSASAQTDIDVTLLQQVESFSGITNGSLDLVPGSDYTVAGNRVTLKKSYLAAQSVGTLNLSFAFGGDYLNDVHSTVVDGDSFEYTFKGTGISMITPTGPEQGEVDIYVDGQLVQTVNAYSPSRQIQQEIYSISGLAKGQHTLKAVKKSGELMLADQLKFTVPTGNGEPTNPSNPGGPSNPSGPSTPVVQPSDTSVPAPAPESGNTDGTTGTEGGQDIPYKAYIQGYPGGLFKPDNKLTRAEMATILAMVSEKEGTGSAVVFSDVKSEYWGADAIAKVSKMGLMNGYKDGTFKPNQPLTRAEMATLVSLLGPASENSGDGFSDIGSHWAKEAILKAQSAGILRGYKDGTFRPNALLTRAEAVVAINRALGRAPLTNVSQPQWKDVPSTHWAFGDVEAASVDQVVKARSEVEEPKKK